MIESNIDDITDRLCEGVHYELTPATQMIEGNDMAWDIRILEGPFVETVIRFGDIKFGEDDMMHYSFIVVSSPNPEITADNCPELQEYSGQILLSVIEKAIENDAFLIKERDEN